MVTVVLMSALSPLMYIETCQTLDGVLGVFFAKIVNDF